MLFNSYRGFNSADSEVQSWCAAKFPGDLVMQTKCSQNNFPMSASPPWTDLGAILRGIPKPSSLLVSVVGGGGSGYPPGYAPPPPSSGEGIFGIPTTIMVAGGAVLAIGVGAMVLSRRKRPAVAGYGSRRRRRKSRR